MDGVAHHSNGEENLVVSLSKRGGAEGKHNCWLNSIPSFLSIRWKIATVHNVTKLYCAY